MKITYEQFEKFKFKNYLIDDKININFLNTLNSFLEVAENLNLKFSITGSISLAILSKKIYRTWKDLDILMDENMLSQCIHKIPRNEWRYENFFSFSRIKLFNIKNKNYIDLLKINELIPLNLHKINYINFNDYTLPISDPKGMFYWKFNIRKPTRIDMDDKEFYQDFIID